jgi:hypothetical protein
MAAIRYTVQDFMSAIRSQGKVANATSLNTYGATVNADGTVAVTRNNVVIFPRIFYNQGQQTTGQSGDQNQDSLTIFSNDGATAVGGVTNFLSTLT